MRQILMLAGGGVAALGALAVGVSALMAPADRFAACRGVTVAEPLGAPFTLTRADGARVTDTQVFDRPSLVYFGYSFCPDVCPVDNARNAMAADDLAARGVELRPVFITIDPERDTPEMIGPFVEAFHPEMVGLTGTPEEVAAVAASYKAYAAKSGDDPDYYLMDHSTWTYLVLPGHGFVDLVRRDEPAEVVAERVACFVANA